MVHNIEGNDLRECIDKSFDAGYNEAVRKAVEWLDENWTSFVNYDDEDGVVYYWNLTDKFKEFMKIEIKAE